ncbi:hypothetical protein [Bradyrhizobium zhanjiangense]|nr:hypothetical protein [Bradyrhizobium zhanjiangense]
MVEPPFLCPLCGRPAKNDRIALRDADVITCQQCGHFQISGSAEITIRNVDGRLKRKIGFWTRDQNDLGEDLPMVTTYTADSVAKLPDKTVIEQAERLLHFGIREQKDLGGRFRLNTPLIVGLTHSHSDGDVQALARFLHDNGWLEEGYNGGIAQISPRGFMHASESRVSESVTGFIAMWFDKSMDVARDQGLDPAIRAAGYTPVIVSGVEHINKIDDEIVSQIRKSKFFGGGLYRPSRRRLFRGRLCDGARLAGLLDVSKRRFSQPPF